MNQKPRQRELQRSERTREKKSKRKIWPRRRHERGEMNGQRARHKAFNHVL